MTGVGADPFAAAQAVADAVLYEGYVLYPYRASSAKNVARWQFGVLMPPAYAAAEVSERASCTTQILLETRTGAVLTVRLRFLHAVRRTGGGAPPWDEAVERAVELVLPAAGLRGAGPHRHEFAFPGGVGTEGGFRRETAEVRGALTVALEDLPGPYAGAGRLTVTVENRTSARPQDRHGALPSALLAAHTLLALDGGHFLSMTDGPEWAGPAVRECANAGTWPVLVGAEGSATARVVLSSPIILGDHPRVAPESAGDLFDATEIDEILTLRTMALTDAEKAEARATDPRAAALIDRVDGLPPEHLDRLHGALRFLDAPAHGAATVGGVEVRRGSRVRLRPGTNRRTDAQDLFLDGRAATVEAVLHDVEGRTHVGVTLDDPDLAEVARWQGRYLYFAPDEVEPLEEPEGAEPVRVLVAGVGNIFLGDDGFGVEVVHRLGGRALPRGVEVVDFGIRGVHLAYQLLEGYDVLILVDAAPRGAAPGTVSLLTVPQDELAPADPALLDAHGLAPGAILRMLGSLGGAVPRVLVVACEPGAAGEGIGLSPAVAAALDPAVDLLVRTLREEVSRCSSGS